MADTVITCDVESNPDIGLCNAGTCEYWWTVLVYHTATQHQHRKLSYTQATSPNKQHTEIKTKTSACYKISGVCNKHKKLQHATQPHHMTRVKTHNNIQDIKRIKLHIYSHWHHFCMKPVHSAPEVYLHM